MPRWAVAAAAGVAVVQPAELALRVLVVALAAFGTAPLRITTPAVLPALAAHHQSENCCGLRTRKKEKQFLVLLIRLRQVVLTLPALAEPPALGFLPQMDLLILKRNKDQTVVLVVAAALAPKSVEDTERVEVVSAASAAQLLEIGVAAAL
jgi:hypothetical protein